MSPTTANHAFAACAPDWDAVGRGVQGLSRLSWVLLNVEVEDEVPASGLGFGG
jgi:hypothetical protein